MRMSVREGQRVVEGGRECWGEEESVRGKYEVGRRECRVKCRARCRVKCRVEVK
jgi:hypothetical protein